MTRTHPKIMMGHGSELMHTDAKGTTVHKGNVGTIAWQRLILPGINQNDNFPFFSSNKSLRAHYHTCCHADPTTFGKSQAARNHAQSLPRKWFGWNQNCWQVCAKIGKPPQQLYMDYKCVLLIYNYTVSGSPKSIPTIPNQKPYIG